MFKNEVDGGIDSPEAHGQPQEPALAENADVRLLANIPVFETVGRSQVSPVASSSRVDRSALAKTYAQILESGGCIGC